MSNKIICFVNFGYIVLQQELDSVPSQPCYPGRTTRLAMSNPRPACGQSKVLYGPV